MSSFNSTNVIFPEKKMKKLFVTEMKLNDEVEARGICLKSGRE